MKKTAINAELLINGKKVAIGHQFLEEIVYEIPDLPQNKEIFDILVHSDNPEIKEHLTHIDNLSKKSIYLLLNDNNQNVVEGVLNNSDFAKYIDKGMMQKIFQRNKPKFLQAIARNVEDFKKCNTSKLVKKLAQHENAAVRYSLIRWGAGEVIPTKVLKQLSKDSDVDVALCAREELKRKLCY